MGKGPEFLQKMATKHMKRYLILLAIKERQIKTTVRYHSPLARMLIIKKRERVTSVDEDVEKPERPHTAGGRVKCCPSFGKQCSSYQKLNTELPRDPGFTRRYLSKRNDTCSHTNLYLNVHR